MVKKQKKSFQKIVDRSLELTSELRTLEALLESIEAKHFQRCWKNGNLIVGWYYSQRDPQNLNKLDILPKDKIFSISSLSSAPSKELEDVAYKSISGPIEGRFISNKKKYKKKKKKVKLFDKPLE